MLIAIPVTAGKMASHFGHCEHFALYEVDVAAKRIDGERTEAAPPHEPGALPRWLLEREVEVVLAGGMGSRAVQALAAEGVRVLVGMPELEPAALVRAYLAGELDAGENACDH